ncbi:MAG: hypothetical protein ACJATP_000194 [Candidatus Azotimanducaceae bacterium]|jgi:hypothetical protein
MPHLPTSTDASAWHRYFAIEANSRAWEQDTRARTPAEDRELLNTAHTAVWHWQRTARRHAMGARNDNLLPPSS